jgi:hypothetical protein
MVNQKYTFNVHADDGQEATAIRKKFDLQRTKGRQPLTIITPNMNGKEIMNTRFAMEMCNTNLVYIESIKFDENITIDDQGSIMKALVGFLLGEYPTISFTILGCQFSGQKHLLQLMKSTEFKAGFNQRVVYVSGEIKLLKEPDTTTKTMMTVAAGTV